ncbi:unnamed protein product, partial [marine sediment metagenome]
TNLMLKARLLGIFSVFNAATDLMFSTKTSRSLGTGVNPGVNGS